MEIIFHLIVLLKSHENEQLLTTQAYGRTEKVNKKIIKRF